MKKTPRRIGRGDHAISLLLGHIAKCANGTCSQEAEGVRLSFPGDPGSIFVAYQPTDEGGWKARLKWVEKQCAVFLLNAPVLYGLRREAKQRRGTNSLRLSFGLSLSLGRPLRKRYCVTVQQGKPRGVLSKDEYLPLGRGREGFDVLSLPGWARSCLPVLAKEIASTCECYKKLAEVEATFNGIAEHRRQEFTYLENLYRRKSGANDRVYGLPEPNAEGSAPIEAELRRLQQVVLRRYNVHVRVHILSLGVCENLPSVGG